MNYTKGDRVIGGRAGWTAHGTVTGVRDESVFVRWDGPLDRSWSLDDVFEVTAAVLRREAGGCGPTR